MCHKKDTCPIYLSHCGKNMEGAYKNSIYLQRAERTSFYAKIALVIAVIGFLVSTYFLY